MSDKKEKPTGLALLREPFAANQIGKLPKPTRAQTDEVKKNFKSGIRCGLCQQWHHPKVVHLDYVGHAALTDRLLDCDPEWNWEPASLDERGVPVMESNGGMWIKLTVCGVTRLGYGHPDGKTGGNAIKEIIGDALRNAGMRFGAALDLWHKGELHVDDDVVEAPKGKPSKQQAPNQRQTSPSLQAKIDAVKDNLPMDATSEQKAAAFASAIIADIENYTDAKSFEQCWQSWSFYIELLQEKNIDLYHNVLEVYTETSERIYAKEAS